MCKQRRYTGTLRRTSAISCATTSDCVARRGLKPEHVNVETTSDTSRPFNPNNQRTTTAELPSLHANKLANDRGTASCSSPVLAEVTPATGAFASPLLTDTNSDFTFRFNTSCSRREKCHRLGADCEKLKSSSRIKMASTRI
ncbi:unnamed protein product [Pleuronectes platessa]|uniref:Uncharacterized protein n=1 Tax=Pleuronectes platessa TaxID=8262 RepID=A0A9N7V8X2_PLEPL|nr:unnamed protein product [Pleuronectes platessa]